MGRSRNAEKDGPSLDHLQRAIHSAVAEARQRWTAAALKRAIALHEGCARSEVDRAIRTLIEAGLLEYCYIFGQSYLTLSFRRPVRIGDRFVIVPPAYSGSLDPLRLPLVLASGSAFGSGRHPTTRLALRGLERCWADICSRQNPAVPAVLDIGTGSGILAIAAARLGAPKITALDIDACARAEARQNIALNIGLPAITVSDASLESLPGRFSVVIANLRLPTLVAMGAWIAAHLHRGGFLVASGLREEEGDRLASAYADRDLKRMWWFEEAGWAGGVFQQNAGAAG